MIGRHVRHVLHMGSVLGICARENVLSAFVGCHLQGGHIVRGCGLCESCTCDSCLPYSGSPAGWPPFP